MKIIIGIILIYIIIVISSASLMRYIWSPYKGTEHEETWKKSLTKFSILYLIVVIFIMMIISFFHFCFNL